MHGSRSERPAEVGLAVFGPPAADALRRIGVRRRWPAGTTVIRAGAVVPAVILVLQGRLRFAAASAEGTEVLFRWFARGELLGLASALGNVPFSVDAVAAEDAETLHFERERFLGVLRADADAALAAARITSRYAWEMTHLVTALASQSLASRVLAVVRRLAEHGGAGTPDGLMLHVSQDDIAKAVGASRQRVNLELHRLERMGHLRLGYRHVVVLDGGGTPA